MRACCAEAALDELPREAKLALLRRLRAKLRALAAALAAEQGVRERAVRAPRRSHLPLACPCPAAFSMALMYACLRSCLRCKTHRSTSPPQKPCNDLGRSTVCLRN